MVSVYPETSARNVNKTDANENLRRNSNVLGNSDVLI